MEKIGPVRPTFNLSLEPPKSKKCERLVAGTSSSGMLVNITPNGVEINAYYTGFLDPDKKYAVLRDPVIFPWEELEKVRARLNKGSKKAMLARIEEEVNEEYLKTLAVVTINQKKYYVDGIKRERRSVEKPNEVWRF